MLEYISLKEIHNNFHISSIHYRDAVTCYENRHAEKDFSGIAKANGHTLHASKAQPIAAKQQVEMLK